MKSTILFATALATTLACSASAQIRPDLSGRWTAESIRSAPPTTPGQGAISTNSRSASNDPGNDWGSDITLVQDGQKLTVFVARSRVQPPLRLVYELDGTESTNMVAVGGRLQMQTARAS
jgi:hypothetical protein